MEEEVMATESNYTCPLGESDLDSDTGNECDMEQEKMGTDNNYTCPVGESDLDSDTGTEYDMEQEEMGTENNMWKLRAKRVKQILAASEFAPFYRSTKIGLEFNVGFGPKQNISVDSLSKTVLLEVAKFALAMNSSQQNFIMEILEYNFDISLKSEYQRKHFTCELMNRVRQLKDCEDAVKFSKEVFELPGPMASINMANRNVGSGNPGLGNLSKVEKCDDAPACPPHSQAETKDHVSWDNEDPYPFCKELGLKLHVNKRQPYKKLDINKLTNGAMTEVTNFAEKLCGTFEQICVDIVRHNLDPEQGEDSDLARSIVAGIPAIVEQKNLTTCVKTLKKLKGTRKDSSPHDHQNDHNSDACSAGSSQDAIIDQDEANSPDIEHQNELQLMLWKLRANHIQQILSIPHEEQCPLYSYSRCKKLGIDFNVGSGVKQNLDPKLLTNGIMVELNTFAEALLSAQKHFITEILEYNFHLDLNNELYRSVFAHQTLDKIRVNANKKHSIPQMKMLFELPDMRYLQEPTYKGTTYCPKCYQDRNHKLRQKESVLGHRHHPHPRVMTDTISADENCTAQKPEQGLSSSFSDIEKTIMDSYPCCKKIGLNLCVDKDQPKDKLDRHVLTFGIMNEVASFAKKLCATKSKIIHTILEHNFNIRTQRHGVDIAQLFRRATAFRDDRPAWFSEVFVIPPVSHRPPGHLGKLKRAAAMQKSEWKEAIKNRKLALQTKEERTPLPSPVVKSKTNCQSKVNCFPICTEMGLDLDMTSKSGEKKILDLKRLSRGVCDMEQEEMETDNNYTCPLGESDLDSDEVKDSGNTGNQDPLKNSKSCSLSAGIPRESESSCLSIFAHVLTTTDISSTLSNVNSPLASQSDERRLHGGEEQTPGTAPYKCDMEQEVMATESNYTCPVGESDLDSDTGNECDMEQEEMGTESNYTCPVGESDLDSDTGTEYDMEQEEMGTENNMWKLRAKRVKQILAASEFAPFSKSKKIGLEFNVGFGPKQNNSVDSLSKTVLLEVAKFALAMNSSQQNFIMEILEYNFDISLKSENRRKHFTCELMNSVRQLKDCEDAVKFSNEVFELPGPTASINKANRSVGSGNPGLGSLLKVEKCDDAPACPPHSQAETKEQVLRDNENPYPFCKELGLKLHVNKRQPYKKLDINKLTNGAMTEVTNFAEKLCGTFEQICVDILRHNLDLDLQGEDSDLARSIVAGIPAIVEQKNLINCARPLKGLKGTRKDSSTHDHQNDHNSDACSAGSSQAANIDQDGTNSPDIEHQNELHLMLWKLRANHIQQIFSIPHVEQCPLYSYSRCKKSGIDFNVGSGVKQNLDPKLLTNGIMVELNTFAEALISAQKHFITEILEYNFHLDLNSELYRSAFAQQTLDKYRVNFAKRYSNRRINMLFELPDVRYPQEPAYEKMAYCPQCYQDRNHNLRQKESVLVHMHHPHPHTMRDAVTADANCTIQMPKKETSSTFSEIEKTIMDSYPRCKKIGLNLCVDKDQPKDKLDRHVLTFGMMNEVASFAKKLCTTKTRIIHTILEHNFNIRMQRQGMDIAQLFRKTSALRDDRPTWFSEVFVIPPVPHRPPGHLGKLKRAAAMQRSELKEAIKNRKLALQTKEERTPLPSPVVKSKTNCQSKVNCFPICTEMGLDLDMTSKSGEKKILDLKRLSGGVCDMEQEEMETDNNYTCPLGESDLDSDTGNECDMEQEEMGTENSMWKLRANRVKQILAASVFAPLSRSKKIGLEFNVGFGPKQNNSVDSLSKTVLLEVAKFALAMNSSQQNFIMEILEYNFDISLKSEKRRKHFTCELMNRVRQLKDCEDAVKFSKEVFELPGPTASINKANRSVGSGNPGLGSLLKVEKCDDAPACPPHSQAETKEQVLRDNENPYPFCKELGLKLHVNKRQPYKKLDINKLTNGAMTEVTNFAEKLCGTFEQICVDILRHNLDHDLQGEDSDLARSIVAGIPAIVEQKNLITCARPLKKLKGTRKYSSTHDHQNDHNSDACSAGSSQDAIIDQDEANSPDIEHQNELHLMLWKLRANHIQQIFSIPHVEKCPLYSYSRCKKLGIDFNVGSGVKQNLDPKLLTNGIMVELNTFAEALISAQKHFITEILEYNFHLDFNSELYRSAFAQQTLNKYRLKLAKRHSVRHKLFELPDVRYPQEPAYEKAAYCPQCYQDRNHNLRQKESVPGHMHHTHPHTVRDAVSADANCTIQMPKQETSSTFSDIEKMIMDSYPGCKKIGLKLCVDKDQPKDKLDRHVLTFGIMNEVANFAKKLCATKTRIIHTILEHNFNIRMQRHGMDIAQLFRKITAHRGDRPAWFSEAFVIPPVSHRPPGHANKLDEAAMQGNERKETIKKRKLALQAKVQTDTLPSPNISVEKRSKKNPGTRLPVNCYPICTEIGLKLDVTSKSRGTEKLDLKLLTRAVVLEIHKYAVKKVGHYLPHTVFDILEYNFDLSSQHHRRWEFSIATATKVQMMIRQRQKNRYRPNEVFRLPFVFAPKASQRSAENMKSKKYSWEEPEQRMNKGGCVRQVRYHSDVNHLNFLDGVKSNQEAWFHDEDTKSWDDPGTMVQMNRSLASASCVQIKEEEYDPRHGDMKPEPDSDEKYHPHYVDVETDPGTIVQINGSPGCGSSLSGNIQIKEEEYDPHYGYMKPEPGTVFQEYSMVPIGQGNESTSIKEEQESVPADSHHYGVHRK